MKHFRAIALPVLVAPLALTLAAPEAVQLQFAPAPDSRVVKTWEVVSEMTLDDMSMMMNGQESPMMPEIDMTMTNTMDVTVVDTYVEARDGRPVKLTRLYDDLGSDMQMSMEMNVMGESHAQDQDMTSSSELEGKTVVFTWNAEAEAYDKKFDPEEDNADLLEGLQEDMDFRAMLPGREVSEGDEWEIDVKKLGSVLAPGGNLSLVPEDMDMGELGNMNAGMGSSMADMIGELIEGTARGRLTGTREVDGRKVAVIAVTIDIDTAKDMTELVLDAMDDMEVPDGSQMEFDHIDIEFAMQGEGQLLWDMAANRMHSFELSGTNDIVMDMAMEMAMGGESMSLEQTMEMSGTMTMSVSTE